MVGGNNACHQKPLPRLFSGAAIIPHSFNTIEPKKRPLFELALGVCEVLVPCVRGQQTICSIDTLKISRLLRIYRHSASSFRHYMFENLNNSETDAFCWVASPQAKCKTNTVCLASWGCDLCGRRWCTTGAIRPLAHIDRINPIEHLFNQIS